jgi:hypothetical protein
MKTTLQFIRFIFIAIPTFLLVGTIAIFLVGAKHFVLKVKSLFFKPSSKVDSRTNNQNTQ